MDKKERLLKMHKELHYDAYWDFIQEFEAEDKRWLKKGANDEIRKWAEDDPAKVKNIRLNAAMLIDIEEQYEVLRAIASSTPKAVLIEILQSLIGDYMKANKEYFKTEKEADNE